MRVALRRLRSRSTQHFLTKLAVCGLLFIAAYQNFNQQQNINQHKVETLRKNDKKFNEPGEGGAAVVIPPELAEKNKSTYAENQFSLLASDMISVNRSLKGVKSFFVKHYDKIKLKTTA